MEQADLKEFSQLIKIFSNFIIMNHIPTEKYTESFTNAFFMFAKTQKLGESGDLVKLNHYINNHQDSLLKLQCGKGHCIECYTQIVQTENYIQNETVCTCKQKIFPNFRKKILEEYERIQKLKETCVDCGIKKDRMLFVLNKAHNCTVCTSCIVSKFNYDAKENFCHLCGEQYNVSNDQSIRMSMEPNLDPEVITQFYRANCPQCGEPKDKREFVQTCKENECEACKKCLDNKKKTKDRTCWCGDEITILT